MSGLDVAAGVVIQIADGIGSAGEEVRICALDTVLFSRSSEHLTNALETSTSASKSTQRTTEDVVDLSERILQPFKRLVERLSPLLEKYQNSEHQLRQFGLRIQWYFKHKAKVAFYQQALDRLKATLTCLLGTINLQEARINAPHTVL